MNKTKSIQPSEYMCKAQSYERKTWVEGFPFFHSPPLTCFGDEDNGIWYILNTGLADWNLPRPLKKTRILPETLSRYTSLQDENGKDIFENDILCFENIGIREKIAYGIVRYGGLKKWEGNWGKNEGFYLEWPLCQGPLISTYRNELSFWALQGRIVGNIFDNADFLKEIEEKQKADQVCRTGSVQTEWL